jgi:hypothetical protein
MRTLRHMIAFVAVLAVLPCLAHAAGTPGQKCAQAKNKAASKKLASKLKCWQKAIGSGATVDPACLTAAETKYGSAIAKIETKGGCDFPGDGATLEAVVNNAVAALTPFTPASPGVCCTDGFGCWYDAPSGTACSPFTVGAVNSVCDAATGGCIAAPATPGPCCSNPAGLTTVDPTNCITTEVTDETTCTGVAGGTLFTPNGLCPPDRGVCVVF